MNTQEKVDQTYEHAGKIQHGFDFSADKRIDINNLHTELQLHSEKCFKYNKRRSKLQAVVDQLEELKKQTRSQLINDCVANPALCDPKGNKYSDKKAEAYYRLDSGYNEVITALLNAKHELDCMSGMQRIIEDTKWILKDLVNLSMSQYFESKESKETRVVLDCDAQDVQLDAVDKAIEGTERAGSTEVPQETTVKDESGGKKQEKQEKPKVQRRRKREV